MKVTGMILTWNESLAVGHPVIDHDHHEFVDLLAQVTQAGDEDFPALFAALTTHVTEHFAREDELMREHNFFAYPVHRMEHERVLAWIQSLKATVDAGNLGPARTAVAEELPEWFLQHRNTMDLVTAGHIRQATGGGGGGGGDHSHGRCCGGCGG
ncbi:Hemerythrin-like domain-containing protein [uncultured Gammaproteobacteria bacterium]